MNRPLTQDPAEIQEVFDRVDENGDGRINLEEFVGLMLELDDTRSRSALRQAFDNIDQNRDGHVSREEFEAWLSL